MICYYCEASEGTNERLGQPACDHCFTREIRTSAPLYKMNDQEKARMLKMTLKLFT